MIQRQSWVDWDRLWAWAPAMLGKWLNGLESLASHFSWPIVSPQQWRWQRLEYNTHWYLWMGESWRVKFFFFFSLKITLKMLCSQKLLVWIILSILSVTRMIHSTFNPASAIQSVSYVAIKWVPSDPCLEGTVLNFSSVAKPLLDDFKLVVLKWQQLTYNYHCTRKDKFSLQQR